MCLNTTAARDSSSSPMSFTREILDLKNVPGLGKTLQDLPHDLKEALQPLPIFFYSLNFASCVTVRVTLERLHLYRVLLFHDD